MSMNESHCRLHELLQKKESFLLDGELLIYEKDDNFIILAATEEGLVELTNEVNVLLGYDVEEEADDPLDAELFMKGTALYKHALDELFADPEAMDGLSFFEACAQSKEDQALRNISWTTQRIINGGDHFFWEEDIEVVRMSGEYISARWEIEPR